MRVVVAALALSLVLAPGATAVPVDTGPLTVNVDVGADGGRLYASDCSPPVACEHIQEECEAITTSGPHLNRTPPVGASVHPECIITP